MDKTLNEELLSKGGRKIWLLTYYPDLANEHFNDGIWRPKHFSASFNKYLDEVNEDDLVLLKSAKGNV